MNVPRNKHTLPPAWVPPAPKPPPAFDSRTGFYPPGCTPGVYKGFIINQIREERDRRNAEREKKYGPIVKEQKFDPKTESEKVKLMEIRREKRYQDTCDRMEKQARNPYETFRIRLERLHKEFDKPVEIPERPAGDVAPEPPPDFIRNVVGSSAGAGSQEFHIYRNNRKKEMARLEYMKRVGDREVAEAEYAAKIAQREAEFEDRTAKKRSKRQKQKEREKMKRVKLREEKRTAREQGGNAAASSDSDSDDDTQRAPPPRLTTDGTFKVPEPR